MLQRAEKREHQSPANDDVLHKRSRLQPACKELCFFCDEEGGTDGLQEVTTFQVDQCVRKCAKLTGDNFILAKLLWDFNVSWGLKPFGSSLAPAL